MITPVFQSHFSLNQSLLNLEESGKAKPDGPLSVFDLAKEAALKEVVLVDDRLDGFIQAQKVADKVGVKLCFGWKVTVCQDCAERSDDSTKTNSRIIIFITNTQGYSDLIRIHNRATTEGFYYESRTDWKTLKSLWTPNLRLALPFFSSCIAKNLLTFSKIAPDFPVAPSVFREIGSELPFEPLIYGAIEAFCKGGNCGEIVDVKSIYYRNRDDFKAYMVDRCIGNKTKFDKPNVDHLASAAFCWQAYKEITST